MSWRKSRQYFIIGFAAVILAGGLYRLLDTPDERNVELVEDSSTSASAHLSFSDLEPGQSAGYKIEFSQLTRSKLNPLVKNSPLKSMETGLEASLFVIRTTNVPVETDLDKPHWFRIKMASVNFRKFPNELSDLEAKIRNDLSQGQVLALSLGGRSGSIVLHKEAFFGDSMHPMSRGILKAIGHTLFHPYQVGETIEYRSEDHVGEYKMALEYGRRASSLVLMSTMKDYDLSSRSFLLEEGDKTQVSIDKFEFDATMADENNAYETMRLTQSHETLSKSLSLNRQKIVLELNRLEQSSSLPSRDDIDDPNLVKYTREQEIKNIQRRIEEKTLGSASISELISAVERFDWQSEDLLPNDLYLKLKAALLLKPEMAAALAELIVHLDVHDRKFREIVDLLAISSCSTCQDELIALAQSFASDYQTQSYLVSSIGLFEQPKPETFHYIKGQVANHENRQVKGTSRLALGNLGRAIQDTDRPLHDHAFNLLREDLANTKDLTNRNNLIAALGNLGHEQQLTLVKSLLKNSDDLSDQTKINLYRSVRFSPTKEAEEFLVERLRQASDETEILEIAHALSFRNLARSSREVLFEVFRTTGNHDVAAALLKPILNHQHESDVQTFLSWAQDHAPGADLRHQIRAFVRN